MKPSPDELEKLIHQTLRSLPDRRAPRSLEQRVNAAIAARVAMPWWRQSYRQWPLAARCVFLLFSGGLAKVAIMAAVWAMADFQSGELANAFANQFGWIEAIRGTLTRAGDFCAMLIRAIPPVWLYSTLAGFAAIYATLFGLGAAAYRTLVVNR